MSCWVNSSYCMSHVFKFLLSAYQNSALCQFEYKVSAAFFVVRTSLLANDPKSYLSREKNGESGFVCIQG